MTLTRFSGLAAVVALAPLFGACAGMVDNDTLGRRPDPAGGSMFRSYAVLGTSIGAGIQSGGINDSTQRETYAAQLAVTFGLTPGVDWYYPGLAMPGCPPPLINPLATPQTRVGNGTATTCARRAAGSARDFVHNTAIPFLRAEQALDLQVLDFPATDTLKLAQFLVGSANPIDMVERARPSFVSIEVGANDILHAATRGDISLMTPLAEYQTAMTAIADRVQAIPTLDGAVIMGIPPVTRIPFVTPGQSFFCGKNPGLCGLPQTADSLAFAKFTVTASCSPAGVGAQYLVPFTTTAVLMSVATNPNPAFTATLDCGADVATVTTPAGTAPAGATVTPAEFAAINTRVGEMNTFLSGLATARNWAFFDVAAAFNDPALLAQIPPFPRFATPTNLFGPLFSQDGVHPTKAGQRVLAQGFAAAINATYGTTLVVP